MAKTTKLTEAELSELVTDPLAKGNKVVIMTVTLYFVGYVVEVSDSYVTLGGAGVIPEINGIRDTFMGKEKLASEVIPEEGAVHIARGSIVAVYNWRHNLPVAG